MSNYWVSWYCPAELYGKFELHSPWWVSGEDAEGRYTICAAIKAGSDDGARETIYECYDDRPSSIEFRFVEERPDDWLPFNDRFPQAGWMKW